MLAWTPQWFIDAALALILCSLFLGVYWLANKILGNELHHLFSIIKGEWEDSRRKKFSVGSMNWRGFIALFIFGLISMIFTSGQKLVGLLGLLIGMDAASQLVASTNFLSMFFFLSSWLLFSLVAVVIDGRGRKE